MAGFLNINNSRFFNNNSKLVGLSKFGTRYEDLLLKNSQAIGFIESQLRAKSNFNNVSNDLIDLSLAIVDTTSQLRTKSIAFFQLDYASKREKLRDLSSNGEIEFILETIADDIVVYDEENRFCYPNDLTGKILYKGFTTEERLNFQDEIIKAYFNNFEKIYNAWGFGLEGISAWQYAYQFLIEGYLSFEIIYDDLEEPTQIIGFKELDPMSIAPQLSKDESGKLLLKWVQYDSQTGSTRILNDSQIIYISYSNHFKTKRVSFTERLIRSFNLLRILEHSKVIWHVMNAPIRLHTKVPTGSKSFQKSKEDVREFLNILNEDIYFNGETGELQIDGKPNILFYKNYVTPVNDANQSISIEALQYPGPNLSGSELLNYFYKKLKMDSKIPYSRWEGQSGMGAFTLNAEGISREEIRYQKLIKRFRTAYSELIIKPWYIQMCLDFPILKDDHKFKNSIGLIYNNDNVFEELKEKELDAKRIASFTSKKGILKDDGTPYFSTEYLIRKELKLTEDEIINNKRWMEISNKAKDSSSYQSGGGGGLGGGRASTTQSSSFQGGSEVIDSGETKGSGQL